MRCAVCEHEIDQIVDACWCSSCVTESMDRKINQLLVQHERFSSVAKDTIKTLKTLPSDALGMTGSTDGRYEWSLVDELIGRLESLVN